VTLVREKPAGALVSGRLVPLTAAAAGAPSADAGYIRIASFRNGVVDELKKQVAELSKTGAKSLIIDVRGTAEGPLENGIAAARPFVKTGTLSIRAARNGENKETILAAAGDGAITLPVQLLVATGTSGPAELFASALRDNKRAELVGEHTLGRAGLQKLVKLPEGRGLWLTYAQYYRSDVSGEAQDRKPAATGSTPDIGTGGRPKAATKIPGADPINGKGLQPDVNVEDAEVAEFGAAAPAQDPILDAAIERLKKKSA
jgi:carboxyl-terminal processing protease